MNTAKTILRIALPVILGGGILWWMYGETQWEDIRLALNEGMDWWWMLASMPFCVFSQWLRAVRWKQMLAPLGESPRLRTATIAIYLSYASSLIIPRVGEVLRCGVLKRYDGTRFTPALGTVVTERIVDMLTIGLIAVIVFIWQWDGFLLVAERTGAGIGPIVANFSLTGWLVTILCAAVTVAFILLLAHRLALWTRLKGAMLGMMNGLTSVRDVPRKWLFALYSVGIWVSYFLHFYVAFFAFTSTSAIAAGPAWVAFVVGTFAVLVPTPNGAGPWHFAVKTVLCIYGVAEAPAAMFCLITHTLQTAFTALLGVYGVMALALCTKKQPQT
ncbi:MAG: flippase-like domain-containing protein [Bacteroidaceae bacterium]|nr:flippase-like domain-containing protein [Bacteroidaceae bacterium]